MKNLSPLKYWQNIAKFPHSEPVKKFCSLMIMASSKPPSSVDIERKLSSAGLIHTKPSNRVTNE